MDDVRWSGRRAGALWVLSAIAGGYGLFFVRGSIIVAGDAAATAANIAADETGYRIAIAATLVCQVLMAFFGLAIYRIFRDSHRSLALVFLVSILVSITIAIVNTFNHFGALLVLGQAEYLKAFTGEQLQAMAMVFLRLSNSGQGLLEVFWMPLYCSFGLLILKSGAMPRVFGVLLNVMGIGFAINILEKVLAPQFYPAEFTQMAMLGGELGGLPTMAWLLVKGVSNGMQGEQRATDLHG